MSLLASNWLPTTSYRVVDPIENLRLQVTLRKRGTQGVRKLKKAEKSPSARRRPRAARKDEDDSASEDDDEAPLRAEEEEEAQIIAETTFRWQEKVFGPSETRALRRTAGGDSRASGVLGRLRGQEGEGFLRTHFREQLARLDGEAAAAGEGRHAGSVLHTRISSEFVADAMSWIERFTTSGREKVTPLARSVLSGQMAGQHRDALGEPAAISMSVYAELPSDDVGATRERSRSSFTPRSRSRGGGGGDGSEGVLVLLCSMRLHPGTGRLDMRPGLPPDDGDDEGADEWHAVAGTRYEWRLRNLAESLSSEQQAAEVAAERALRLQAAMAHARAPSQLDFTLLPQGSARLHHFVELVAAKGFGPTPLYIEYYAWAAPGWRLLTGGSPARAITQVAAPRGASGRAVLGFPIELAVESEGAPVSKRPPLTVFFSVMSIDAWRRHKALGYTYLALQPTAGTKGEEVRCWKVGESRSRALDAFFVGGSEAITDMRALAIPDGHVRRRPAPPAVCPTPAPPGAAPTAPPPFAPRRTAPSSRSTASTPSPPGCSSSRRRPSSSRRRQRRSPRRSAPPPPLPRRRPRRGRRPRGRRCRCARSRSSGRRRRRATACASGSRSARSRRARSPRRRRRARAARPPPPTAPTRTARRRPTSARRSARSRSSPRSWAEGMRGGREG